MGRRAAAAAVLGAALAVAGAAVRAARPPDAGALERSARALQPTGGAPALIVLIDPECPACRIAVEDLHAVVRPEELGLALRVAETGGDGRALRDAVGPGLVPVLLVTDAAGRPVAMLRGARSPSFVRGWLEAAAARAFRPTRRRSRPPAEAPRRTPSRTSPRR